MLPLIKISCILVSTVGLWITLTPPHPPPAENEKAKSTSLEFIVKQRFAPFMIKVSYSHQVSFFWGIALAETATLAVQHTSNHSYSGPVLSLLIFPGGAAERIRASPTFFIGVIMTTLGGFIRHRCYRALGSMYTFEMSIRKDHMLVTSGPYGVVRHPAYTGVLLTVSGILFMHGSEVGFPLIPVVTGAEFVPQGSWVRESGVLKNRAMGTFIGLVCGLATAITFGLLRRMSKEDEALHQLAGKNWEDWARRVPYKLIPCIY